MKLFTCCWQKNTTDREHVTGFHLQLRFSKEAIASPTPIPIPQMAFSKGHHLQVSSGLPKDFVRYNH